MNAPIGVIDSGVGGLTVAKQIMKLLPEETIYYIGDTARCPYGPRSRKEVREFTWQMAEALRDMGVKMLVIACNTATAVALHSLQKHMPFPVLGVINAGARAAIKKTKSHEIVVLATEGTVKSGAYEEAILSLSTSSHILPLACPTFVPLVESGEYRSEFAQKLIAEGLEPLNEERFDTVILGCTHFPIIEKYIAEFFNGEKHIIDAGFETVTIALVQLHKKKLLTADNNTPHHRIFIHGENNTFEKVMNSWIPDIEYSIENILLQETY